MMLTGSVNNYGDRKCKARAQHKKIRLEWAVKGDLCGDKGLNSEQPELSNTRFPDY